MAAKIQFRRGLEADRASVVADAGEPLWASDTKKLHVGDGSTPGGIAVLMSSLAGSIGLAVLAATTQAAARDAIGLGASDSPTFAGLGIGVAPGAPLDVLMGTTGRTRFSTDGVNGTYLDFISADAATWNKVTARATQMSFLVAASGAPASGLVLTPSAPGTAGAGEVRVGGGQIDAAGSAVFGGHIRSGSSQSYTAGLWIKQTGDVFGAGIALQRAGTLDTWAIANGADSALYLGAATNASGADAEGDFGLRLRIAQGGQITIYGDACATAAANQVNIGAGQINAAGAATFGGMVLAVGGFEAAGGSYAQGRFYRDSGLGTVVTASSGTAYDYLMVDRNGNAIERIDSDAKYLTIIGLSDAPTAPSGCVNIGHGKINAAGDIETATKFRVNGSDQPVSTVSLVNVNASSTYDLLTVGDNEMWSLAIGNATDGYMVHAVFGKPSASSGAVMATNNNTNANLTVALVGNILRISNGVGSTRTMIYTLTKLR